MALRAQPLTAENKTELEYRSASGPVVTHVRGGLLASSLQNLKNGDLYDDYLERLPAKYHDAVTYSIAASWISLEVALAHCATLDAMNFAEGAVVRQGEHVGSHWGTVLYGAVLKTTRSLGGDMGWILLKQSGRLMERVYRGGGCRVLRLGPKDALLEIYGLPLVRIPYFRTAHHASMRSIAKLFGHGQTYVRPGRPLSSDSDCIATTFSWV